MTGAIVYKHGGRGTAKIPSALFTGRTCEGKETALHQARRGRAIRLSWRMPP